MEQNKKILLSIAGDEEEDKIILKPFSHIQQAHGKESFMLVEAFNHWLNLPKDKLDAITEIADTVYTYSLIIDDVQDSAEIRDNIPTSHRIYGKASTINGSSYALFIALEKVLALNHPKGPQVFTDGTLKTYRGQGMGQYWRRNNICPSKGAYEKAAIGKSAEILRFVVELMQLFSDCKEDFTHLIETFGYYFQIRNDYLDFLEEGNDKTFAIDLTEGEFSFPIVHAIHSHPEDTRVMDFLSKRIKEIDLKRDCVKVLDQLGAFTYTKTVLEDMDKQIRDEIKRLGGNPIFEKFLDTLLDWKTKPVP